MYQANLNMSERNKKMNKYRELSSALRDDTFDRFIKDRYDDYTKLELKLVLETLYNAVKVGGDAKSIINSTAATLDSMNRHN